MFKGIITPIVTPFNNDTEQTINYDETKKLIDNLISKGVSGIFPLGSNGEFHVLSYDEKVNFSKFVIDYVNKRVPVYVGTGACSTQETISLSKEIEKLGADALSIITPYFINPTDEEIIEHYTRISESVNLPIIIYNIPKNTGYNVSKEVLLELSKLPNIKGIKDSSGDINNLKEYIEVSKISDINVLIGSDSKIFEGYQLGATGAIAGTSNLITSTIVELDKSLRDKNYDKAKELQNSIEDLRAILKYGTVPSILKRAIQLSNISNVGNARKPVKPVSKDVDRLILEMLDKYCL